MITIRARIIFSAADGQQWDACPSLRRPRRRDRDGRTRIPGTENPETLDQELGRGRGREKKMRVFVRNFRQALFGKIDRVGMSFCKKKKKKDPTVDLAQVNFSSSFSFLIRFFFESAARRFSNRPGTPGRSRNFPDLSVDPVEP